jgi:uncharacterized protein (DUF952 family)
VRIFKILRESEWLALQATGETDGSPADVADGFIHFSTESQLPDTLAKHFCGETGLWLLACEADSLAPLRWEPARDGARFPHLYRPLRLGDVLEVRRLPKSP